MLLPTTTGLKIVTNVTPCDAGLYIITMILPTNTDLNVVASLRPRHCEDFTDTTNMHLHIATSLLPKNTYLNHVMALLSANTDPTDATILLPTNLNFNSGTNATCY